MTEPNRQNWDNVDVNVNEDEPHLSPSPTPICTVADETDSKELEIHRCLTANCIGSDHEVDLIHLRKLAESPGGLKTIALRRLAWPKLVAAHQVLWDGPPMVATQEPLAVNSREIHRLVQRTKWSKYQITKSPKTFDELLGLVLKADVRPLLTPRPSFADLSEGASDSVNANSTATSNRIRRVSFDLDLPLDAVEEPSHRQLVQMARDERQLLRKLLCHIYRCHPDAPLFDGLQNLMAVLWIVIESPSLTSITSLQLIQYQWMPQSPSHFMKLLSIWDPTLHEHFLLQENSSAPPHGIINSWIPHWFSSDLKDVDVLLRIWDVLIVNPPITIVYFAVALVVHFRDSLLRAKQQPIFQAILHHLPSDGLEKYDMVEPILQRCLQALHDYPPEAIIESASVPPIPKWVFHSTAPTDSQVIQRLAEMRLVMPLPNPSLPTFDNPVLLPASSHVAEVALTPPSNNERCPWHETLDETPCSTPESIRSVKSTFQAKESPKLPTTDMRSLNWLYKIVTMCGVGMALVAATYSLIIHSSQQKGAGNTTHNETAAPNSTIDTFSSDDRDHSMPSLPAVAPLPCPHEESRATSTPNYVNLAWPDSFQITLGTPSAATVKPLPPLDTDVMALLHDYGGNMCHPLQEFDSYIPCEDGLSNSFFCLLLPVTSSVPPEDSNTAWLAQHTQDKFMAIATAPESRVNEDEVLQLGKLVALPNGTRIDFAPASVAVDHDDFSSVEPSAVPTPSYQPSQPKLKPTRSSLWSNHKSLFLGLGNFLMESTEAHFRGRREAHILVVDNVQRLVRNQANGKNPIFDNNVKRDQDFSKRSKQRNQIQRMLKVIQKKASTAATLALEATAVRLDASRAARTQATELVATLAQQSKLVTEDGIDRVRGHLLATTNRTLDSVGMNTRTIARNANRIAHQLSSVASHKGSKFLRALHHGLTTKYSTMARVVSQPRRAMANAGQAIQGKMGGFPLLKQSARNVVKDYKLSSQTFTEVLASSIAIHSAAVLHVGVSLFSQKGVVILREIARFWDQLAETFLLLRMWLISGKQMLEIAGRKGISIADLAALAIKEGINRIGAIGTVTEKWPRASKKRIARLASSENLFVSAMARVFLSGSHFVGELTNRLRENVLSRVPSRMSRQLRKIVHFVARDIFPLFSVVGELGLHFADMMEDAAISIRETTLATIVSVLMAGKRTYRSLEKGGQNVLLATQFAWNCVLVYLALIHTATRQRIVHIGAHSGVGTFGNKSDGSPNEHFEIEGAIVATDCVHAIAADHQYCLDCTPHALISVNATKKPPGEQRLYPALVEVRPVEVTNWAKVRPTVRRSRGAADVARDALRKKSNRNMSVDQPFAVLEEDIRMTNKATIVGPVRKMINNGRRFLLSRVARQSRKLLVRVFSQSSQPILPGIQPKLSGRNKRITRGLAQATAVMSKTCSHVLDNLALHVHYLQAILGMSLKNHRDSMRMFRGSYLNLTLREAEHSALFASYNMFFVIIALIEVGKKEMQHSSERQITAVRHVSMASWRGIEKAAALRKENANILKETIIRTIAKVKGLLA